MWLAFLLCGFCEEKDRNHFKQHWTKTELWLLCLKTNCIGCWSHRIERKSGKHLIALHLKCASGNVFVLRAIQLLNFTLPICEINPVNLGEKSIWCVIVCITVPLTCWTKCCACCPSLQILTNGRPSDCYRKGSSDFQTCLGPCCSLPPSLYCPLSLSECVYKTLLHIWCTPTSTVYFQVCSYKVCTAGKKPDKAPNQLISWRAV